DETLRLHRRERDRRSKTPLGQVGIAPRQGLVHFSAGTVPALLSRMGQSPAENWTRSLHVRTISLRSPRTSAEAPPGRDRSHIPATGARSPPPCAGRLRPGAARVPRAARRPKAATPRSPGESPDTVGGR